MITPFRPSPEAVARYQSSRSSMEPTFEAAEAADGSVPDGFGHVEDSIGLGRGGDVFGAARDALLHWAVHPASGVTVTPDDAVLEPGTTVTLVTRQLGLWVVCSCRVTEVVDRVESFGFTYATLPGHPERGVESFTVDAVDGGTVRFTVSATSAPDDRLARLAGPVSRELQRQATRRYLRSMVDLANGAG